MKEKTSHLLHSTRVMTLAISNHDVPWSSPVYFVFHDTGFYFFSNKNSRHIRYAGGKKNISASIFHDSDQIDKIFGFQMSGRLKSISEDTEYLVAVKKYVMKFGFLKKIFGPQILENKRFFLEKFKSTLYCFIPHRIYLSDNADTTNKRQELELHRLA